MANQVRAALVAEGRARRQQAPRTAWAEWIPPAGRDPLAWLEAQHERRVANLVPLRRGRMAASPFAFYRGAAAIMTRDLLTAPSSGICVQACGDAHLSNFGLYASPERALVFDLNDFDETLPAPFEWDVARLAASMVIASRDNGFEREDARTAAMAALASYRERIRGYARLPTMDIWYDRVDVQAAARVVRSVKASTLRRDVAKIRQRSSERLLSKLTTSDNAGNVRIVDQPGLISHLGIEQHREELQQLLELYLASLAPERRVLVGRFRFVDFGFKVVGVGSVGTLCFVALALDDADQPLFLQVKEATKSVLEVRPGSPVVEQNGERVVIGQRLMQAVSDIFLGWSRVNDRDYYVRQLHDMKGSVDVAALPPKVMCEYAALCGWVLARAHARAGEPARIAGYLGNSDNFDRALARFAETYAAVNETDHARLSAAISDGILTATTAMRVDEPDRQTLDADACEPILVE
jgi:uncharacterized protein (DUF2252 family)